MEIVKFEKDGAITVRMSAREAKEVRGDLDQIWGNQISQAGDTLHRLLEWANPQAGS